MRRLLSFFWFGTLLVLVACNSLSDTSPEQTIMTFSPYYGSDTSSQNEEITEKNAEKTLRGMIQVSSMVVEATLSEKETVEIGDGTYTDKRRDIYTFNDIEVITGVYEKEILPITVFQAEYGGYYESVNFQIGCRYILIVQTNDSVNYFDLENPENEETKYRGSGILCQVNSSNHEIIDSLYVFGFQMDSMIKTKQEIIDIVAEEVGIQNTYYNICEQYVHSDVIADIVHGADIIAKVYVNAVDNNDELRLVELCDCTLKNLYKGQIATIDQDNQFRIKPRRNSMKAGEEYIVLLDVGYDPGVYYQAAKKNAIIPMTDTDRVQQVYDALGIDPES